MGTSADLSKAGQPVEHADRPTGRDAVTAALKQAALELLAERGTSFSTREVATRANVNHGLVHRHFGSNQELLSAALADRNAALERQLVDAVSPFDLSLGGEPPTAVLLARLILDDATESISDHLATRAIVAQTAKHVADDDPLSAGERVAIANAISLGWAVFGQYAMQAAGVPPSDAAISTVREIVDGLTGPGPPAVT